MKRREEKEIAREERARLREERRVEKELAEERAKLDKERQHLENTLAALRATGEGDEELSARLEAIDQAIAQNDYRVANIRAGYVSVISNPGAFGNNVVKIGLTRRLDPIERIREPSGASVPFGFEVHAAFFSEDAVSLEADLHRHYADRALNRTNPGRSSSLRRLLRYGQPFARRSVTYWNSMRMRRPLTSTSRYTTGRSGAEPRDGPSDSVSALWGFRPRSGCCRRALSFSGPVK